MLTVLCLVVIVGALLIMLQWCKRQRNQVVRLARIEGIDESDLERQATILEPRPANGVVVGVPVLGRSTPTDNI